MIGTRHRTPMHGKRLYQEWVVDQYSKVESQRLFYIRNNQGPLRAAIYGGVADAIANNDANIDNLGRFIVLPSSFIGGHRHMVQLYQDSMAIVRQYGKPDLFITMTCNPKWEEIVNALKPGKIANDHLDLVTRVFVGKLHHLLDELLKKGIFGEVVANIHIIEWHKKGLPHAHILLILHSDHKPRGPDEYDCMVSAELPDKDAYPTLFEVVTSCMLHGPCGTINPHCPYSMLLQTHWLYGSASRRTWQKTSCIKHARLVLSSARVWLCMSAYLAVLHGHGLHVVRRSMLTMLCVCSYNVQGEPARQLDAAIRDMVLRELALQLAHLNSSQGLATFGLPTLAAQPASAVVADEIARYDAATQAAMRDEHVPQLNPEQRVVYDNVMAVVDRRAFFVDGLGGTGKTFFYSYLLSTMRAQG